MKKILFLAFVMVSLSINSFAQDPPKFVYSEIVGTQKFLSQKITIIIDFGQKMSVWADQRLKDPTTGKARVFNSMIDALNYMGKQGWEFAQAYVVTIQSQNVYHYLMKKPFEDLDEDEKAEVMKN